MRRKTTTALERWLDFCRNLRIQHGITQVYVTPHAPNVNQLVNLAKDMQVTIVAKRVRRDH